MDGLLLLPARKYTSAMATPLFAAGGAESRERALSVSVCGGAELAGRVIQ
jgi:hypothetical protein